MIRWLGVAICVCLIWSQGAAGQARSTATNNDAVPRDAAAVHGQLQPGQEPPSPGELLRKSNGSLLKAAMLSRGDLGRAKVGGVSYTTVPEPEPKTVKKHDLVTIIIREESEFTTDGKSELKKSADLDAKIDQMIQFSGGKLTGGGVSSPLPQITLSGKRNFNGEGKVDRTDSFVARIEAMVVDVKPNGTFAVEARKTIKVDEEVQEYLLTGVCRRDDLTLDNTVLSTQIHDLQLQKINSGSVKDSTKRGWIPKLLDFVNPF